MSGEELHAILKATDHLTLDELADLVNHLGDGTLADIQKEPWKHHIAHLLPANNDVDAIHALWVMLIEAHDRRFIRKHLVRVN